MPGPFITGPSGPGPLTGCPLGRYIVWWRCCSYAAPSKWADPCVEVEYWAYGDTAGARLIGAGGASSAPRLAGIGLWARTLAAPASHPAIVLIRARRMRDVPFRLEAAVRDSRTG